MQQTLDILTPQEQRMCGNFIEKESVEFDSGRERILRMWEELRQTTPRLGIERAMLFTESFQQTEGEPINLRWAKALKHIAENIPVYIGKDELIVGRGTGLFERYGFLYPELEGGLLSKLEEFNASKSAAHLFTQKDADILNNKILPYWQGKAYHEAVAQSLPAETRKFVFESDNIYDQRLILMESATFRHSQQWVLDYEKILKRGFKGLKDEAKERLEALDNNNPIDEIEKKPFLEAAIITCDAAIILANRYSKLANDMARKESDVKRKEELQEISRNCAWVPENPARTFHEAVQSQWFTQLLSRFEQKTGGVISNGRMDQYFYPYFKKDFEEGRIDNYNALEILENLWLNMASYVEFHIGTSRGTWIEGYAHWEALTIGGKTKEGHDATNELTYLILKSKRDFPIAYPDLAARIHSLSPERYLHEVCDTLKEGSGFPKLFNDEEIIPYLLQKKIPLNEANDYALSGCTEVRLPNRDTYYRGVTWLNLPAVVEMALNDGRIWSYKDGVRYGASTGDAMHFTSFDQFFEAFKTQFLNTLKHTFIVQVQADKIAPEYLAAPQISMLNDCCMNACRDIQTAHVAIPNGIPRAEFDLVGYATAVDSIAAIKYLVFDKKEMTMGELLDILENNFEGNEAARQKCLHAPKYGNNNPYVDSIGLEVEKIAAEYCDKYPLPSGTKMHVRYVPVTNHITLSKIVSATPDGRKAFTYLSDGASPAQGVMEKGASGALLSNAATKYNKSDSRAARLLNVKFSPSLVEGSNGTKTLMSFIRTWEDLKLWHLQFNIINQKTLIEAQKNPEKYRDLIVRVAGFSAFFVDLSPQMQEEIIARTQLEEV